MIAIQQRAVATLPRKSRKKQIPEADIVRGDILYIYKLDEYDKILPDTELKAVADKPYKKRTQLKVPLICEEEV